MSTTGRSNDPIAETRPISRSTLYRLYVPSDVAIAASGRRLTVVPLMTLL